MRFRELSFNQTKTELSFLGKSTGLHLPSKHSRKGMTLVEISIAVALLGLISAAAIATLMTLNKNAASTRVMTNVKEIVQRNIEAAIGAQFTASNVPAILALTSSNGSVWDDDGGGDNKETIYTSRDATSKITGTMTRIVLAETNTIGADIRRVTFHLDYTLFGRPQAYEMTTIRALDR